MKQINNITFIGSGNVATNLAFAFHQKGKNIVQIVSRDITHAKMLADKVSACCTNNFTEINTNADLYIICVNDDAIINIASSLKLEDKLVVHTSGSVDINALKNTSTNYGVFYPLQTFNKETIVDFKNVPLRIEAVNKESTDLLTGLAACLTDDIRLINSEERRVIHLAAVFACNFTNYMYLIADELLSKHNIPFDILKPLIAQTASNIETLKPFDNQTGPAKRNDVQLIEKHLLLLKDTSEYHEIYKGITKSIVEKFKT